MVTFADASTRIFDGRIAIDIRQQSKTNLARSFGRIRKSININRMRRDFKLFPNACIQLIIADRRPMCTFDQWHRKRRYMMGRRWKLRIHLMMMWSRR